MNKYLKLNVNQLEILLKEAKRRVEIDQISLSKNKQDVNDIENALKQVKTMSEVKL